MESAITSHVYAYITLFGHTFPFITDAVITMWLIMAVIAVVVLVCTRRLETVPKGGQKLAEAYVGLVNNICQGQIGHHWKTFVPYIGSVLLFLGFANICAIFNFIPSGETLAALTGNSALAQFEYAVEPPTRNFNVTLALALMSIVVVLWAEFRFKGGRGVLRSFYRPTPINGFVKVLDLFTRPLSLCLRLFGNIVGGSIVMALIYSALPWILPAFVAMYFDLFDGLLQAYVFVFLTTIYLSEATEEE